MPVNAGDTIAGSMSGSNCSPPVCADWTVTTTDLTTGASSVLRTTSYGEAMDDLVGGALEVYGIDQCAQLPAGSGVQFNGLFVTYPGGGPMIPPSWSPILYGAAPSCAYGVTSSGSSNAGLSWLSCTAGQQMCGAACSNPQTDRANCGACGNNCQTKGANFRCINGACIVPSGTPPCRRPDLWLPPPRSTTRASGGTMDPFGAEHVVTARRGAFRRWREMRLVRRRSPRG